MALVFRLCSVNCQFIRHITKPVKWSFDRHFYAARILASDTRYTNCINNRPLLFENNVGLVWNTRQYSTGEKAETPQDPPKQGLMQRLKAMYRDYWYVTVPVHMVTSAMWFGGFYYAVRSGVDAIALLESIGVSETLLTPLRDSSAGYVALTLALYKVVTPLRYAVTLGGTTFAIRRLEALGWIKPVPSKARLKEMYQEKKDNFQDVKQHYKYQYKEKRNNLMVEMRRYKQEMKNKVKKM